MVDPNSLALILCGATALSLALVLFSEHRSLRLGVWIFKPLASTCFCAVALARGALDHTFGQVVLLALVLSWLGDVLLIPAHRRAFLAGLVAFLLGHMGFSAAFLLGEQEIVALGAALVVVAGIAILVGRWLLPQVGRPMKGPVLAYILVISSMVVLAAGAVHGPAGSWRLGAAVLFFASDIFVARQRFVAPGSVNRFIGLPLYYAAQLLFAWTVATPPS